MTAGPPRGPSLKAAPTLIEGRSSGGWVVGGRFHPPALLVSAAGAQSLGPLTLDTLDAAKIPPLPGIDLLLLGTGPTMRRPPAILTATLAQRGLRVEAMDTNAAARTFNVLVAEERPVAALLI